LSSERLEQLFDGHHQRLYRLARRLCRDSEEARDLVQETWLRAARHLDAIPAGEGGEGWLVRVLVNLTRDRARRIRVRERAGRRAAPAAPARSPEGEVVARATVRATLGQLPPRRRAVIVLHYLEDRAVEEIAGLLGISRVTVRWHLAAGRRSIESILTASGESGATARETIGEKPGGKR
jgi:RNA polymerase sigma factor (sigma-70 family)